MEETHQKFTLTKLTRKLGMTVFILVVLLVCIWYLWLKLTYNSQGIPNGLVSCDFIKNRPEAKLYYPNGTIFSPFCHTETNTFGSIDPAFAGAVMLTGDSQEKVYQWYHDRLLALGWDRNDHAFAGLGDDQKSLQGYFFKGRGTFYVAILDPVVLGMTLGRKVPTDKTVFEFRYVIR